MCVGVCVFVCVCVCVSLSRPVCSFIWLPFFLFLCLPVRTCKSRLKRQREEGQKENAVGTDTDREQERARQINKTERGREINKGERERDPESPMWLD